MVESIHDGYEKNIEIQFRSYDTYVLELALYHLFLQYFELVKQFIKISKMNMVAYCIT
ncbi:hypothetical protein BC624_10572 [Flavobacterium granuli]|uniref:Uncharacterized protein n=1 Tax=Flavobacterium granuli TaxID=280093 RepID=A0A1M5NNV7_9FLAO|nr:hypothetical protein BC624_10572 [Flavobacterium granuli]SHG91236.1 hypothetical protein SAMN05443373_10572 [Flavobacterium granuli]